MSATVERCNLPPKVINMNLENRKESYNLTIRQTKYYQYVIREYIKVIRLVALLRYIHAVALPYKKSKHKLMHIHKDCTTQSSYMIRIQLIKRVHTHFLTDTATCTKNDVFVIIIIILILTGRYSRWWGNAVSSFLVCVLLLIGI